MTTEVAANTWDYKTKKEAVPGDRQEKKELKRARQPHRASEE